MEEGSSTYEAPEGAGLAGGHTPVLLKEAIDFLAVKRGGTFIDATVGLGGHSFEIARRLGVQGRLIGFDKDAHALEIASKKLLEAPADLASDRPHIELVNASFASA